MKLIDADVLKFMVTEGTDRAPEGIQLIYMECVQKIKQAVIECIEKIPDVEVVPKKYHDVCMELATQHDIAQGREELTDYCPYCEAKMDGGKDDAQE